MDTKYDFRLNFNTDRSETLTINVPRADDLAAGPEVSAAMEGIIASGVVQSARGGPLTKQSAELIATVRKDFNIR